MKKIFVIVSILAGTTVSANANDAGAALRATADIYPAIAVTVCGNDKVCHSDFANLHTRTRNLADQAGMLPFDQLDAEIVAIDNATMTLAERYDIGDEYVLTVASPVITEAIGRALQETAAYLCPLLVGTKDACMNDFGVEYQLRQYLDNMIANNAISADEIAGYFMAIEAHNRLLELRYGL